MYIHTSSRSTTIGHEYNRLKLKILYTLYRFELSVLFVISMGTPTYICTYNTGIESSLYFYLVYVHMYTSNANISTNDKLLFRMSSSSTHLKHTRQINESFCVYTRRERLLPTMYQWEKCIDIAFNSVWRQMTNTKNISDHC